MYEIKTYQKNREITGSGVDIFIDAAGVQAFYYRGIQSLCNSGISVLVALFSKEVTNDALNHAFRELTIKGIIGDHNILHEIIVLINNRRLPAEKLVQMLYL